MDEELDLGHFIIIPEQYKTGIAKCRILYDIDIKKVEYASYQERKIIQLKIVDSNIDYAHKSADRNGLDALKQNLSNHMEVLILKEGKITDSTFSHIIFRKDKDWYTSNSPLLGGVMREFLLDEGRITETEIRLDNLSDFDAFMLINAMMPFDESRVQPIINIMTNET